MQSIRSVRTASLAFNVRQERHQLLIVALVSSASSGSTPQMEYAMLATQARSALQLATRVIRVGTERSLRMMDRLASGAHQAPSQMQSTQNVRLVTTVAFQTMGSARSVMMVPWLRQATAHRVSVPTAATTVRLCTPRSVCSASCIRIRGLTTAGLQLRVVILIGTVTLCALCWRMTRQNAASVSRRSRKALSSAKDGLCKGPTGTRPVLALSQ